MDTVGSQNKNTLPHLPKGINMAGAAAPDASNLQLPGRSAAQPDWTDSNDSQKALVPQIEGQQRQGNPHQADDWSQNERALIKRENVAAPVFTAQPKGLQISRGSEVQRQVYRMQSGINPVELLCSRLASWRIAIKCLVAMFKHIADVETKTATGYCKSSKFIDAPFHNSQSMFKESGGIQEVWTAFRNYAIEQSVSHQDYVNYIERSILPSLRNIKSDIKTLLKSTHKDDRLKSNAIYNSRMHVDALVAKLDKAILTDSQMPENAYQVDDPVLVNCSVYMACKQLHDHENQLHTNVLNFQKEVGLFEQNIVENCRVICEHFLEFRVQNLMEHQSMAGKITETFQSIRPDTEWNEFVRRNEGNFVSEKAAFKTDDDIAYPNQYHPLVQPIKIGLLQRKGGVIRSWNDGFYILTPAGFLHGFKSPEAFDKAPEHPEISIFIPHTNVNRGRGKDQQEFEIRGKNAQAVLGVDKNFSFRAVDGNEFQDWLSKLLEISDRFRPLPLIPNNEDLDRSLPPLPISNGPKALITSQAQQSTGGAKTLITDQSQANHNTAMDHIVPSEQQDASYDNGAQTVPDNTAQSNPQTQPTPTQPQAQPQMQPQMQTQPENTTNANATTATDTVNTSTATAAQSQEKHALPINMLDQSVQSEAPSQTRPAPESSHQPAATDNGNNTTASTWKGKQPM